jgi:ABC-type phosphate transport system substrate-binding protein
MLRTLRILLFAVLLAPTFARADIVVIVNASNPIKRLSEKQVADLYLGRARAFPGGEYALVFDLPRGDALRDKFFTNLAGMSPQQVNAYWSRFMFTGQVLPPQPMPNDRAVLDIVKRNPGAIGYVKADDVDASVRVVLTVKE